MGLAPQPWFLDAPLQPRPAIPTLDMSPTFSDLGELHPAGCYRGILPSSDRDQTTTAALQLWKLGGPLLQTHPNKPFSGFEPLPDKTDANAAPTHTKASLEFPSGIARRLHHLQPYQPIYQLNINARYHAVSRSLDVRSWVTPRASLTTRVGVILTDLLMASQCP